jgi:hypothetical protein
VDPAGAMSADGVPGAPIDATVAPEREIARDLVRHAAMATPVAMVIGGIFAGVAGVGGALLGMIVVAANFAFLARLMTVGGRSGASGVAAGAMAGYLGLVVAITLLAVAVRKTAVVDLSAFVLTVGIAHIVLLVWELPRVGLTLGAPGVKPRPLSRRK